MSIVDTGLLARLRAAMGEPLVTASFGQQRPNYSGGPVRVRNRRRRPAGHQSVRQAQMPRPRTGRPEHVQTWEREARLGLIRRVTAAGLSLDETYVDFPAYRRRLYARLARAEAGVYLDEVYLDEH